jgi:hypothetical protein
MSSHEANKPKKRWNFEQMVSNVEQVEQYVLGACVLIAYFNNEVGAEVVEDLLTRAQR